MFIREDIEENPELQREAAALHQDVKAMEHTIGKTLQEQQEELHPLNHKWYGQYIKFEQNFRNLACCFPAQMLQYSQMLNMCAKARDFRENHHRYTCS